MASMQLRSEVSIEVSELIGGVSQLDTQDIERLLSEIGIILAQRKAQRLPERESTLLLKIGEGLPDDVQNRYDHLQEKALAEQITPDEYQELLHLIEKAEHVDAERLGYLIELSQLRQTSLDELMSQLDIYPPPTRG